MILVLGLYFGSIFYLVKKVIETTKMFENDISDITTDITTDITSDITSNNINMKINMDFDKENIVYKAFMLEVNKNKMDTTRQVLICCTGDEKTMSLLSIASTIFNHVHVLLIDYDETETMKEFIEDICDFNDFTFHCFDTVRNTITSDITTHITSLRYEQIDEICSKNDIKYVFEGHDMTNYSNNILNDIYNNNNTNNTINTISSYIISKPFLLIDNTTLSKFISYYNIPFDNNLIHSDYSNIKNKSMFNDMDCYTSTIYPDWRINLIEYYNNKTSIDTEIIENKCFKGKYGFLFYHDFNKISFIAFKRVVNKLCSEYNFFVFDNNEFKEYYLTEEDVSYFINEEYESKVNDFEEKFESNIISNMIDNNSENEFSELDINDELSSSDDEKEYILRVDLNNDIPTMKLVHKISDKFREEYLDGIIYINIIDINNNQFFIYDINTEFVYNN
jgi:hypothetical protein